MTMYILKKRYKDFELFLHKETLYYNYIHMIITCMHVYHTILHRYITLLGQLNFPDIYYISPIYTVSSALKFLPVCVCVYILDICISSKYMPNIHSYTYTHIYSVNERRELVIHRGSLCRT